MAKLLIKDRKLAVQSRKVVYPGEGVCGCCDGEPPTDPGDPSCCPQLCNGQPPTARYGPLECVRTLTRLVSATATLESSWTEIDPQGQIAESEVITISGSTGGSYDALFPAFGCVSFAKTWQMTGTITIGGYGPSNPGTGPYNASVRMGASSASCLSLANSGLVFLADAPGTNAMDANFGIKTNGQPQNNSTNIPTVGLPTVSLTYSVDNCNYTVNATASVNVNRLVVGGSGTRIIAIANFTGSATFAGGVCAGSGSSAKTGCTNCGDTQPGGITLD